MYKHHIEGGYVRIADCARIPASEGNRDYAEVLAWIDAGNDPEPADIPPPPTYRQMRQRAYVGMNTVPGLGREAQVITTIGDVLDTLITEIAARGAAATPEFQAMLDRIAVIKLRYPKPE